MLIESVYKGLSWLLRRIYKSH